VGAFLLIEHNVHLVVLVQVLVQQLRYLWDIGLGHLSHAIEGWLLWQSVFFDEGSH